VTVLFADVVHSMDIAAAVGPERLREIIADLADRCAAMVQRNGGTVSAEDIANKSPDAVSGAKYSMALLTARVPSSRTSVMTAAISCCRSTGGIQPSP
jgi:class 3 adenylate cyclase